MASSQEVANSVSGQQRVAVHKGVRPIADERNLSKLAIVSQQEYLIRY